MKHNNNLILHLLFLFILVAGIVSSINKTPAITRLRAHVTGEPVQEKKTNAGTVYVQLMPSLSNSSGSKTNAAYNIRITLRSFQPVKKVALMQYMNTGIKNNFCAVQDNDTLSMLICERIPGINSNDFLYITRFNHPRVNNPGRLRLSITDTIAGFGVTAFEIQGWY